MGWVSLPWSPRPPSSPDQLADELDEEFSFHLDQLESELVSSGMSPEAARVAALEQFGDPDVYKRACLSIILGDAIMKRVLLISTVVLTLAVVMLVLLLYTQSVARQEALQAEMTAREAALAERQAALDFVQRMIAAQDPAAGADVTMDAVLEAAAQQLEASDWSANPEVEQRLRQAIEDARRAMEETPPAPVAIPADEPNDPPVPAADEGDAGDDPDAFVIEGGDWLTPDDIAADLDELAQLLHARHSYAVVHDVDIDGGLDAIADALPDGASEAAFTLLVERFMATLHDAHASVDGTPVDAPPARYLPFVIEPAGDRYVALRSGRNEFLDPAAPYVTEIDGEPIETWVETASAQVNQTTPQWTRLLALRSMRDWARMRALREQAWTPRVSVTLTSEDGLHDVTRLTSLDDAKPRFARPGRPDSGLIDNDRVGYLRLERMDDVAVSAIETQMPWFVRASGLIIDVRGNTGGTRDPLVAIYPKLTPVDAPPLVANLAVVRAAVPSADQKAEARRLMKIADPRWSREARQAIDAFMDTFNPQPPAPVEKDDWRIMVLERGFDRTPGFDRPVVILTDHLSFSATDIFVAALAQLPHVTVMGAPTAGGSGMSESFRLPSGLQVRFSQMASYQPNGRLYDGVGVTPDVIIEPTARDVAGATDSALDAAIAYIAREREAS